MRKPTDELGSQGSFDPETLTVMTEAFDLAWHRLQESGMLFATGDITDIARHILATSILQSATNGERDPQILSNTALLDLAKEEMKKPRKPSKMPDATMSREDLLGKADECTRAIAAAGTPTRRDALAFLQKLWITLANECDFLSAEVLAAEIAEVSEIHAELMKLRSD